MAGSDELLGDEARPGRHIEHGSAVSWHTPHHRPPPARILSEGERRADPIVGRAEWSEELAGVIATFGHASTLPWIYPWVVTLLADLERIATLAEAFAPADGAVSAVLPAEATPGRRTYLCAFETRDGARSWLVLDGEGGAVDDRRDVKDTVSIAALCEIAEESAVGGDLDELLSQLVALKLTENPEGIDEAEDAVRALQQTIGVPPQLASPSRLDEIGAATRRLELALDPAAASPFTAALKGAQGTLDELLGEVVEAYRVPLAP